MKNVQYQDDGLLCSGHVACAGCSEPVSVRVILNTIGKDAIGVVAPSCSAMICGGYPISAVQVPMFHTTLESAAASASGVKRALLARNKPDTTVFCFVGDGGTYDIGLQALSSAAERNEDILYICFDNEGYMNTGGQKSSSTPLGAVTGSTPAGKATHKKNMIEILAAHRVPYVATASPSHLNDLRAKIEKAKGIRGTKVIIVFVPCVPGWAWPMTPRCARRGVPSMRPSFRSSRSRMGCATASMPAGRATRPTSPPTSASSRATATSTRRRLPSCRRRSTSSGSCCASASRCHSSASAHSPDQAQAAAAAARRSGQHAALDARGDRLPDRSQRARQIGQGAEFGAALTRRVEIAAA